MESPFVITVLGQDKVGIVAGIAGCLAQHGANIIDISQTVLQDLFSMIMLVSMDTDERSLPALKAALDEKGRELEVKVMLQHEDVFRYMHRV
jgi:ACT domain-containing protein